MSLDGVLPEPHYSDWVALVCIIEMVYNTQRKGWNDEDIDILEQLILHHNILTEEVEGIKSCFITLHNLLHLPTDIRRFSSLDNYWCYVFERAVKNYVKHSPNCKNLEYTFAREEYRREFLKFFLHSDSLPSQQYRNGLVNVHMYTSFNTDSHMHIELEYTIYVVIIFDALYDVAKLIKRALYFCWAKLFGPITCRADYL